MKIAVIGLGYVGLPLAMVFAEAGVEVVGVEAVAARCDAVNAGRSYIQDVPATALAPMVAHGSHPGDPRLRGQRGLRRASSSACPRRSTPTASPTSRWSRTRRGRWPATCGAASSSPSRAPPTPGTTRDELAPILEGGSGLTAGVDFHLAFSPERVDPGRYRLHDQDDAQGRSAASPRPARRRRSRSTAPRSTTLVPVSTPEVAEMTKLLENIFRSVNIALMNELAMLCDRMKIDVWEVIDAAATKPFGFMKFQPGPGLGGHCIPVDPFYLSWKAREFDFWTEFIELAGKVNENMPYFCVEKLHHALNTRQQEPQRRAGAGARRRLQGRHRRPARVAGAQGHPQPAVATAPRSPITIRTCPSSPSSASRRSTWTATGRWPATTPSPSSPPTPSIDYRAVVEHAAARPRLPQRDRRHPERRQRLETLTGRHARDDKVRVGVVGLGYWGPNLARNFDRLPDAELAYCCDLDEANLAKARSLYPNAVVTDDLERCSPTTSSTPSSSPPPCRRTTRSASAPRGRQARLHREAHRPEARPTPRTSSRRPTARGVKLMVGHLLEYHPAVAKMKELIDAGELGRVFYVYAQPPQPGQGAPGRERPLEPRRRTTSRSSTTSPATSPRRSRPAASATCRTTSRTSSSVTSATASGMVGHLHVSWLDPHKSRKITVVGEKKMVVFDDMEADRKITVYDKGATTTRTKFETYGEFVTLHFGDIHIPKIGSEEPLRVECQHFVDCIREDEQPRSDGRDALNVVRVLEAMERSLREGGRPVKTTELGGVDGVEPT